MGPRALISEEAIARVTREPITIKIMARIKEKLFDRSENEMVLFEIPELARKELKWKKQDLYLNLLPITLELCDRLGENFDELFYGIGNYESYRDLYFAIMDEQ